MQESIEDIRVHGSAAFGWSCLAESVVVAGPIH